MARYTTFLLALAIGLFSCQNSETSTTAEAEKASESTDELTSNNWQLTTSEGFNIHHPADWEVDLSGFMGSKFLLYLPTEEGDDFRENLNLMSQQLPKAPEGLKELGALMLDQLPSYVTDAKILSHGVPEHGQYFETSYSGTQGAQRLSWYQRCFLEGNIAHILAYTADQEDFDASLLSAKRCMDSFQLPK